MTNFAFPVQLTPDTDDGGYVVTFRDLPEAITQGDSVSECLTEAGLNFAILFNSQSQAYHALKNST
jgi:hypothetical protein